MNDRDELIQWRAEQPGLPQTDDLTVEEKADLNLYRQLYGVLAEEPEFALPSNFAARMAAEVRPAPGNVLDWLPLWVTAAAGCFYLYLASPTRSGLAALLRFAPEPPMELAALVAGAVGALYLIDRLLLRKTLLMPS
jgi:hypothetical protein